MEEVMEQKVGHFTLLNIHNQLDWVENIGESPNMSPWGLSKCYMSETVSYYTKNTQFKHKIKKIRKATDQTYILYNCRSLLKQESQGTLN